MYITTILYTFRLFIEQTNECSRTLAFTGFLKPHIKLVTAVSFAMCYIVLTIFILMVSLLASTIQNLYMGIVQFYFEIAQVHLKWHGHLKWLGHLKSHGVNFKVMMINKYHMDVRVPFFSQIVLSPMRLLKIPNSVLTTLTNTYCDRKQGHFHMKVYNNMQSVKYLSYCC